MTDLLDWQGRFGGRTLAEHAAQHPSSVMDATLPADGVSLEASAEAHVNSGRWLALCPAAGCGGAEYVNLEEPLFFCCECRNAAWGHHPIKVTVPDGKTRTQISAYLCARPVPGHRNWLPDETVKQLRDENRVHGVRLPA